MVLDALEFIPGLNLGATSRTDLTEVDHFIGNTQPIVVALTIEGERACLPARMIACTHSDD